MQIETTSQTEQNVTTTEKNFKKYCEDTSKKQAGLRDKVKTLFDQYIDKKVDKSQIVKRTKEEKKLKMR
jgi:hypothetical protein